MMNEFEELLKESYNELEESEGSTTTGNISRANVSKSPRVERRKRSRKLSKALDSTEQKRDANVT